MKRLTRTTKTHLSVLSELFVNISAGYIGLLLIAPFTSQQMFAITKNIFLAIVFYVLAVRLRAR